MKKLLRRAVNWSERLAVQVTAYVACAIIAFAAVVVLTNVREGHELLVERLIQKTDDLGSFVAELAASQVDELRELELKVIAEDMGRQREVEFVEIVDENGTILADKDVARRWLLSKSRSPVVAQTLATGEKIFVRGPTHLDAAIPIKFASKLVGAVHLKMSLASTQAGVAHLTNRYLLSGGILIVIAIPVSVFFMARATRQIRRVTGAAQRVAAGDLEFEFEETAKGEVGELQRAFSHMKTALKENIAENERLAYTDSITGLPNRPAFRRALKRILEGDRREARGAVLFLDLDGFKKVNDTFGHDVGDELLKLVSMRLESFLIGYRSDGAAVVARLGGDEFTLLLPGIDTRDGAELLAAQIIELVSQPFSLGGQEILVGASVGITLFPDDSTDCDKLLRNADLAMYAAKDGGRQTQRMYSPELEQSTVKRLTLEGELRKAVSNKEFEVFYQPKVSCEDGRVVGAEALVRWQHPTRGLLGPAAFLSVAEEVGLIAEIGWQVMEQAVMEAARYLFDDEPISLAVNVS